MATLGQLVGDADDVRHGLRAMVDIPVARGILERANGASEEVHHRLLLTALRGLVGERPSLRLEGFPHEVHSDLSIRKAALLSDANLDLLEGLKYRRIIVTAEIAGLDLPD